MAESLGHAYIGANQPEEALAVFEETLAVARALGDKEHQAEMLVMISQFHMFAQRWYRATKAAKQALKILTELEDTERRFESYVSLISRPSCSSINSDIAASLVSKPAFWARKQSSQRALTSASVMSPYIAHTHASVMQP